MLHGMQIVMRDIQAICVQIQVLAQAHANKQVQTFTRVYSPRGEWQSTLTSSSLQLRPELRLRDALAHGRGRRDAAGDGLEQVVGVVGAGPLRGASAE